MKTNPNMVNRKCEHSNNPEICRLIQKECNCYQCPITELEFYKKNANSYQDKILRLEKENHDLKILLAEKTLKEKGGESNG